MKTIFTFLFLLLLAQLSFSNSSFCPDAPSNDSPCINDSNPPIDLTGGGSHTGTTCCATMDINNEDCSAASDSASVWYIYSPNEADGFDIILEPGDAEGPMALEVYKGASDAGCIGGLSLIESKCNTNSALIKLGNCFTPDEVIFVKITTSELEENCGTFVLTIVPTSCGEMADKCSDLADQDPIEVITNMDFIDTYYCVIGCLDYACPESSANGGCSEFEEMPTVWFQVIVDDIAGQMFTTVEPNGSWDPIWSIYSGPDCDNLTIVDFGGTPPCSNGDNTPELHQNSVFSAEENYWISVTVDPASLPSTGLDDGSFELCVATTINAIICLGELEGGLCSDESLVMEVTDRELENLPLDGPFAQGEEVTINISFFYDASESGADWFMGFVPNFGPGWDLENYDYAGNTPVGNGQTAQWYDENSNLAPIIQEWNPILCTFTDEDGNLQICNLLCSTCSDCPQPGMNSGDPLPSGYFWVTNGENIGCENDGSPGEGWGIGSTQAQIDWTFTLTVKEFDNEDDCSQKNDLSINFQTFSSGVAGCWEDPVGECLLDRMMFSTPWKVECEALPGVTGFDQEICHDGITDVFLQTVDGSSVTITVEVEDNPNVVGEMSYTFEGGTGTIQDNLLNLTNDVQVVVYSVSAEGISFPGFNGVNKIEVTVYPELNASFPPVFVCENDCTDIMPDIVGGLGAPYSYQWSNGDTTASINVCPVVPTTYFVTVADALGCMDVAEVQLDIKPSVELLLPESIDVVKDDNFDPFDPDYFVCIDLIGGSPPFNVSWTSIPPGLIGTSSGIAGECYAINEEFSSSQNGNNGQYTLTASITDFFGCANNTSMLVNIIVDSTVHVLDEDLIHKVSINPNPSNDAFNISLNTADELNYMIRDMVGREVSKGKINQLNKTVFLGNEPNGVYFIVLTNPQLKYTTFHKLLKI